MNIQLILIGLGVAAIFIWSKLSPTMPTDTKPTEKTELLETPLPEPKNIMDVFEKNAPKVAAIVGAGAAAVKVAETILPAATVLPKAVVSMLPTVGSVTIPTTALPAATVLPKAVVSMLPTAVSVTIPTTALPAAAVMPKAVLGMLPKTGAKVAAPVAAKAGLLPTIGGAILTAAPLIVVPFLAKALDAIFGIGKSGLHDDPELLARQQKITEEKMELVAKYVPGAADPTWNPKSGFYEGEGT